MNAIKNCVIISSILPHTKIDFLRGGNRMDNQQPLQTAQNIMPQPPNIISTKDHLYMTDMLSWNLLAMKKAYHWAAECTDPEVKQAIQKSGEMHQRHYERLLNHLKPQGMSTQQMTNMPQQQQ